METLHVQDEDVGQRLDVYLASHLTQISRARLQKLMGTRAVLVNDQPARSNYRTRAGDVLSVDVPEVHPLGPPSPESLPLDIIFEDDDLLVVNKGRGMVVHPAPGAETGTLVNALLGRGTSLSTLGGLERPGIVHRLDKDTTGLLVVAKTDLAHTALQQQIQQRTMSRKYYALLWGRVPFEHAVIDAPIARHPTDRKRMAVAEPHGMPVREGGEPPSRPAVTEILLREHMMEFSWVEAILHTGRTHQIRVHCAFAGYPVVGDATYGGQRKVGAQMPSGPMQGEVNARLEALHGQGLHAHSLSFTHPRTGQMLEFSAPLPNELAELIYGLRANQENFKTLW